MTSLMSSQRDALAPQSEGFRYMSELLETGEFQKKQRPALTFLQVAAEESSRGLLGFYLSYFRHISSW